MINAIGIDADGTLWHNEVIFEEAHATMRACQTRTEPRLDQLRTYCH